MISNRAVYERHAEHCRELAARARAGGDEGLALWWEREAERCDAYAGSARRREARDAAGRHAAARARLQRLGQLHEGAPAVPEPAATVVCSVCGRRRSPSGMWALPDRTVCEDCRRKEVAV